MELWKQLWKGDRDGTLEATLGWNFGMELWKRHVRSLGGDMFPVWKELGRRHVPSRRAQAGGKSSSMSFSLYVPILFFSTNDMYPFFVVICVLDKSCTERERDRPEAGGKSAGGRREVGERSVHVFFPVSLPYPPQYGYFSYFVHDVVRIFPGMSNDVMRSTKIQSVRIG